MSYQDEVRVVIEEFRKSEQNSQDMEVREKFRRRVEVLDFLVNHEIPRLEREVDELSKENEDLKNDLVASDDWQPKG